MSYSVKFTRMPSGAFYELPQASARVFQDKGFSVPQESSIDFHIFWHTAMIFDRRDFPQAWANFG